MADGVVVCDADGRILYANRRLEQLTGYTRQQLVASTIETLVPARLRLVHEGHRQAYSASPSPRSMGRQLQIRLLRRDGSELPVDVALSPLTAVDGSRVVGVVRDVTERNDAERQMREQAQLLELAHDSVLIRTYDNSTIVYWNQGAVETYGFSRKEALGKVTHAFLRTVFPEPLEELERSLLEHGRWDGELKHTRRDGAQIVVSSRQILIRNRDGKPSSIFEINRDVTAERRDRQQLEAVAAMINAIISGAAADVVLQLILTEARRIVPCALAALSIHDGDSLIVRAASGERSDRLSGMRMPVEGSLSGQALTSGQPLRTADLSREAGAFPGFVKAAGAGPALFVPIIVDAQLAGTIALTNPVGGREFTQDDERTLQSLFAALAGVGVGYANARRSHQQLATLNDRERIARDLHDGAIQTLFAVGMSIQSTALMTGEPAVAQRLTQNVTQLDDVIRELRSYIFDLRPSPQHEVDVATVLEDLVAEFETQSGISSHVEIDRAVAGALRRRAGEIRHLVNEGLSNVRRHAKAQTCRLTLRQDGNVAVLVIADDGRGFNPRPNGSKGQGLRSLRERSSLIGAAMSIESSPGAGTRIEIRFPLSPG